jgi:pyruvate kinase
MLSRSAFRSALQLRAASHRAPAMLASAVAYASLGGVRSVQDYRNPRSSKFSMTKIVGTIGPVSESQEMLQKLTTEGLRIMRINFSHAEFDEAAMRIENLRKCRGVHASQDFNLRAVLHDTKGPEIRTGKMKGGNKVLLETGKELVLTTDPAFETEGTPDKIYVTYKALADTLSVGDTVLLADGLIRLTVVAVEASGDVR